jgi:hypothetical protein
MVLFFSIATEGHDVVMERSCFSFLDSLQPYILFPTGTPDSSLGQAVRSIFTSTIFFQMSLQINIEREREQERERDYHKYNFLRPK